MKKIKVLIADDHNILQHGLCRSFEMKKEFKVIAKARNGQDAINLAEKHHPDLVIMDVSMPHINGMESTTRILLKHPDIKIIALSMHMEKIYVTGMMKAGASGYMLKSCSFKELLTCIHAVLSGEIFFCDEVKLLIKGKDFTTVSDAPDSIYSLLSKREREVLQLLAEGNKSKSIARIMDISVKTVDIHRTNLKNKLKIRSIAELTKFAIAEGLTSSLL